MKALFENTSISGKLTRMNLLVSSTALLLASLAFFSYDILSFRQSLVQSLVAEARIIGSNSISALIFEDQQAAGKTLEVLEDSPDIQAAAIRRNDGSLFASFRRPGVSENWQNAALSQSDLQEDWTHGRRVLVASRIVFQGKPEGVVYISAQLSELRQRAHQYALIATLILIFCTIAALLVTGAVRRLMAWPIIALAQTARRVSRDRDYSVRAEPLTGIDEIAVLIDAFNQMLVQIQERDTALEQARQELEERVQDRTAELQAANKELEAFSYTVAHDLRGPLDGINGMIFLLRHETEGNLSEQSKETLVRLRRSTDNMAGLIDDLLNLSRAGTVELNAVNFNLSEVVHSIAEDLRIAEPDRKVEFVIAENAEIHADRGLMRVVMENLLRNAWKYTSHHPSARIEFGCITLGYKKVYFVRDDGAGFDAKNSANLFQPFQRLHSKKEFSGSGVGLATVQRILARHGGAVWAEAAVEQGATFYFSL
ncbi:MAG TPA: ATP-binding protein [Acidobacteriaceae bacterium]|nr:ATP-binding protein [Acidobacteriaceae bacterium]